MRQTRPPAASSSSSSPRSSRTACSTSRTVRDGDAPVLLRLRERGRHPARARRLDAEVSTAPSRSARRSATGAFPAGRTT